MMKQYRLLTSDTADGLLDQINDVAEQGFELDKFEHSGTADNNWQGIAIMVKETDSIDEFDYLTPEELKEVEPEAKDNVYLIRNSENFPICDCFSEKEAIAVCEALNINAKNVLNSML